MEYQRHIAQIIYWAKSCIEDERAPTKEELYRLVESAKAALPDGENPKNCPGWINLDYRTPHTGEIVLVYGPLGQFVAYLSEGGVFIPSTGGYSVPVTHWMKLPEVPYESE